MFDIAIIIAVVVALVELIKRIDIMPKKFLPLVSLILGLIAGVFYIGGTVEEQIMQGLIIGLSASGLFDQSKVIRKEEQK